MENFLDIAYIQLKIFHVGMLVNYIMENKKKFRPAHDLKLMDQVRQVLQYHHYAYRTEKTYCSWIEQYIRFHKCNKHPREMGKKEIESFLSHLATDRKVSASTQLHILLRCRTLRILSVVKL